MRHLRLTIRHDPRDPEGDLTEVARLRRHLQVHSRVEIDRGNYFTRTQRDADRNAFFEFATEWPEEVRRVLREHGHEDRVTLTDLGEVGLVCCRCGFFAGYVTVCPNCHYRDIDPCPHCGHEVAREHYQSDAGDFFLCPKCNRQVRLQFNPDLFKADGTKNEPVVIVQDPQAEPYAY